MIALGMPGPFEWVILMCVMPSLWLCWLPYVIAKRKLSQDAIVIGVCGIVGAILVPLWIVAIVWALVTRDNREPPAFPGEPRVASEDHAIDKRTGGN